MQTVRVVFNPAYECVWIWSDTDLSRYLVKGRKTWWRRIGDEVDLQLVQKAIEELKQCSTVEFELGRQRVDEKTFVKALHLFTLHTMLRTAHDALRPLSIQQNEEAIKLRITLWRRIKEVERELGAI